MQIVLSKLSPTHHLFEVVRDGGTREHAELETKTFLMHDFLHFALETEAGLTKGFYGQLRDGIVFKNLRSDITEYPADMDPETRKIEMAVGMLSGLTKGVSPQDIMHGMKNMLSAQGEELSDWMSIETIELVAERMRALVGEWNALPRSRSMTLSFP